MSKHKTLKERFIQFGEGGFLRGFADWMIQKMNDLTDFEGSVVVVQPIENGLCDLLSSQNCEYTHLIRGKEGVEITKVDIISRCVKPYDNFEEYLSLAEIPTIEYIISNTTEAGIAFDKNDKATDTPPSSFPAKLTLLLKRRFDLGLGGFTFLPCELIDKNGEKLRECVLKYAELWGFEKSFSLWIENENTFTNTLVDRINTGYPKDEAESLNIDDKMLNTSEYFHLWVIESEKEISLPFKEAGLNVIVTKNELYKYRTRKVRILNGAHTTMVPYALLSGFDTVKSCMDDQKMYSFVREAIFEEIIPTLDLPKDELESYAEDVLTRFSNPYIKHYLSSIALNSVSKFGVRVLPSILEYKKRFGTYPKRLVFAFSKLIEFYKTDMVNDVQKVCEFMKNHTTRQILANESLWGCDLSDLCEEIENNENK